jgi:hypothetical protein
VSMTFRYLLFKTYSHREAFSKSEKTPITVEPDPVIAA